MSTYPLQTNQCLENVRNFLITLHRELQQSNTNQIHQTDISLLDKVALYIKKNKNKFQAAQQNQDHMKHQIQNLSHANKQMIHTQKRLQQKIDQISVLRQTVKTLYSQNQKLSQQKMMINKQLGSIKQSYNILKKKHKRQDDEMSTHKQQLNKLTNLAQQRLNQYAKNEEDMKHKNKKLNSQNQKLKKDLIKFENIQKQYILKQEHIKRLQNDNQNYLKSIEKMKFQIKQYKKQVQQLKQKISDSKIKTQKQIDLISKQLEEKVARVFQLTSQNKRLEDLLQNQKQQNKKYEEQILARTQKLKQKNKQLKTYGQQITKLALRIQQLSRMSDQFMNENRLLNEKCRGLQERLSQYRNIYNNFGKMKGQINQKKNVQLGMLMESLGRLQNNL